MSQLRGNRSGDHSQRLRPACAVLEMTSGESQVDPGRFTCSVSDTGTTLHTGMVGLFIDEDTGPHEKAPWRFIQIASCWPLLDHTAPLPGRQDCEGYRSPAEQAGLCFSVRQQSFQMCIFSAGTPASGPCRQGWVPGSGAPREGILQLQQAPSEACGPGIS